MKDEIFAIEPTKKKKSAIAAEYISMPYLRPQILSELLRFKLLSLIPAHFRAIGVTISENIHWDTEKKRKWNKDEREIQERIRPFLLKNFLHFLHKSNFLHRTIAQIY